VQPNIQTVLLTRDPGLESEIEALAAEVRDDARLVVHVEADERRALLRASERHVDLVFIEVTGDPAGTARFAEDLSAVERPPVVVAIYREQEHEGDAALSSRFVALLRAGVSDFLSRPISTSEFRDVIRREFLTKRSNRGALGRVVSFIGSKGGVGKSTLSVNVAVALARSAKVLLIDGSLQHGVGRDLLGVEGGSTIADAAREASRLDPSLLRSLCARHESGVDLLAAPVDAIDAAGVDEGTMSRLISVARRAYDFVVVDTFPLVDSITLAVFDLSDVVHVVLNDSLPTVTGTAQLFTVLDRVGVDPQAVRVVLNRTHRGGLLSPVDVATRLGREIDHVVPYSRKVLAAADTGHPPAAGIARLGRWGRAISGIAAAVSAGTPLGGGDVDDGADALRDGELRHDDPEPEELEEYTPAGADAREAFARDSRDEDRWR